METMDTQLHAMEAKYKGLMAALGSHVILEPTWVGSGETLRAFDGKLSIVLSETSDTSKCRKDSEAVGYLGDGKDKKKLCLRTAKPETFKYGGGTYQFHLLQSENNSEGSYRYCISIYK
jgi:hypothetical protein